MAYADPSSARVTPSVSNYSRTSAQLGDIRVRLTTGNRIVRNGDEASSISTASLLKAQTSALRSALTGGAKASSFLQVAYDGLDQIRTILESLSTLTVQANETGQTTQSYATLDSQFQSKLSEIDRVVAATTFEGSAILDGSRAGSSAPAIYVGNLTTDTITLDIDDVSQAALFAGSPSIGSAPTATAATTTVGTAKQAIDLAIEKIEAYQLRLATTNAAVEQEIYGVNLGIDGLIATNTAEETNRENLLRLRQNTAATILAQAIGVNSGLLELVTTGR